jgi:hypothetical protein
VSALLEAYLARLYLDRDARAAFVEDPRGEAIAAGLAEAEVAALERIDRVGLELAARSFAGKRAGRTRGRSWLARLLERWRRGPGGCRGLQAAGRRASAEIDEPTVTRPRETA